MGEKLSDMDYGKLVHGILKNLEVWNQHLQAALLKDSVVFVNRVIWSPDGLFFGLRFEKVTDAEVGSNIISTESRSADFLDTRKWIEEVRADRGSDVIIVLVGKKIDIVDKRKVSVEEGEAKATELKGIFIETKGELDTKIKDRKYELLRTQEIV
ncbi:ras-related protein RABH1b [Artemisia annua]|uniref:Ras-related protein RABH1b n=1 Tax=Artemisia annua TaxID=35608 RepID=A0A2U1L295_ARTAN|nr:ras-related protein RABH1b [Artemisia annua]